MFRIFFVPQKYFTRLSTIYLLCLGIFMIIFIWGILYNAKKCDENISTQVHARSKTYSAFLAVVIFSSPQNQERRQIIRNSWLLLKGNKDILHFFAIGTTSMNSEMLSKIKREHNQYKDLLMLDTVSDSYSRLSEKLREILRWLDENVIYSYMLKVDDDSFVHLTALHNIVLQLPQKKLYWGFFDGQASVKTKGKWTESNWFLCDRYLPYAKGGGYLLSEDLVHLLVTVSNYLTLYQNEDVSLGTWLAPFEIKRLHEPRFDTEFLSRGCSNTYLVIHKQSTSMMTKKYENILSTGNLCSSEYRVRNSYIYNWNVPPSLCCIRNDSKIP